MPRNLSDEDVDIVVDALVDRLAGSKYVERDIHWDDHEWVKSERHKQAGSYTRREKIITQIVGALGAMGILAIVTWLGHAIITTLQAAMLK